LNIAGEESGVTIMT